MTIEIVGAGLAGLLAANMLRHRKPVVYEAQPDLPNNHSAVLRFRSSIVGDVLGIPFKKVTLVKHAVPWRNPVADALAYAQKNGGIMRSDRSIILSGMESADRYIAPPDLINRMAEGLCVHYGVKYDFIYGSTERTVVSTIPMPALAKDLRYPHAFDKGSFSHSSGSNIHARIRSCDAYVSLLFPDPTVPFSRISLTGNDLIIECPNETWKDYDTVTDVVETAGHHLGLKSWQIEDIRETEQKYAKINPIDDDERKNFIAWGTDQYNIFSLGRFATWRPGLLLDSLVNDIRLIDRWIGNRYEMKKSRSVR